jgi:HTH-type transcriptional regulator / antitoxin HigA
MMKSANPDNNLPLTCINLLIMKTLKYTIIKSEEQYFSYCNNLAALLEEKENNVNSKEEVELLTLLIEKWDSEHSAFIEVDPIELLHSLMIDSKLKAKDLVDILGVSKGLISDILNYKKGLSKEIIRLLSAYFKVSQEAFNRPYKLKNPVNSHLKGASVMNTPKGIEFAI